MRLWPRRQGSSLDLLVVGLGNPGREYERNRHNVGAMVVVTLALAGAALVGNDYTGRALPFYLAKPISVREFPDQVRSFLRE